MKKTLACLTNLAAMFLYTAAQASDEWPWPWWQTEHRIIGENNLEPIEAILGTKEYKLTGAIARMETSEGKGFCSAVKVGEDLFLTNYHCYEFKPNCEEIRFTLGYERQLPGNEQLLFKCEEVLSTEKTLDYALYRVSYVKANGPEGFSEVHRYNDLNLAIPDNDPQGVTEDFSVNQKGALLEARLHIKIDHPRSSDLEVEIISPAGTSVKVPISQINFDGSSGIDKTYIGSDGLKSFLGEEAEGNWQVTVRDKRSGFKGTWKSLALIFTTANSQTPGGKSKWSNYPAVTLWGGEIKTGQLLFLASHPRARMKEIDRSAGCKIYTTNLDVIGERRTIKHTCDTEGGSSGSALFDRNTGNVVALHWGGKMEYNMAIPMNLILGHLKEHITPEVYSQLKIEQ